MFVLLNVLCRRVIRSLFRFIRVFEKNRPALRVSGDSLIFNIRDGAAVNNVAVENGIDLRCSLYCREEGRSKSCIGRPGIDTDS